MIYQFLIKDSTESLVLSHKHKLSYTQTHSRTFDPIWLPHWPACKWMISLIILELFVELLDEYYFSSSCLSVSAAIHDL